MVFLIESLVACALFTFFVFLMSRDPVKTIFNYPPAIIERCDKLGLVDTSNKPGGVGFYVKKLTAMAVFGVLLGLLVRYVNGCTSFWSGCLTAYALWVVVNWWDAIVMDCLWFCHERLLVPHPGRAHRHAARCPRSPCRRTHHHHFMTTERTNLIPMPSIRKILLLLVLSLGFLPVAHGQTIRNASYQSVAHIKSDGTIQDGSYRTIGHIKSDGTVQDGSYRTIGHLRKDGTVQDESYRTVGHIKKDGTVQDSSYRTVGHVREDGTVQDASYRTIGHAGGIPMEWVAFYFFFHQ